MTIEEEKVRAEIAAVSYKIVNASKKNDEDLLFEACKELKNIQASNVKIFLKVAITTPEFTDISISLKNYVDDSEKHPAFFKRWNDYIKSFEAIK